MSIKVKITNSWLGDAFSEGDIVFITESVDEDYFRVINPINKTWDIVVKDQIELLDKGIRNLTAFQLHTLTVKIL